MSTVSLETRQRFTGAEPSGTIATPPFLVSHQRHGHAHAMPKPQDIQLPMYAIGGSGYTHADARQMGDNLPVY
jgi:hypothetical protein